MMDYVLCIIEDHVVIVGDTQELGAWNPAKAPRTSYEKGHHSVVVILPSEKTIEFKWAILDKGKTGVCNMFEIITTWKI